MASVLVTRPAGQGESLAAALREAGHRVLLQPLLTLEALPQPEPAQRTILQDLDRYRHIIFISGNAVRYGLNWIDDYWPQLPAGVHWYGIGETTAALLRDRGLRVLAPAGDMTSEGLLQLAELQNVEGDRVLLVKGEGGRQRLRQSLESRGALVDELCCYRRGCPQLAVGELAQRLAQARVDTVLISSGEGLANLLRLLSQEETTNLSGVSLLVPSGRVAREAQAAGFTRVTTADNASDAAMLRALASQSRPPESNE